VREFSTPLVAPLPRTGNLTDDVVANGTEHPDAVVCNRRVRGTWSSVTAARFLAEVSALAKGLVASGVAPGDRVALISRTRYEWTLADYAIWFAGAVSVPLYETAARDQIHAILADSGARAVLAETLEHRTRIDARLSKLPVLEHVWVLEEDALNTLTTLGAHVSDGVIEDRRTSLTPDSLATLIYTSGTTGSPKGCMLTHGNFMSELSAAVDQMPELFTPDDASTLLFLPLAHVFARVIAAGAIRTRTRLGYSSDMVTLLEDLSAFRPTFLLGVPRVFEQVFNTASQRAAADGRGRLFDRAADAAIAYSRALDTGGPGVVVRARHAAFDRLVYGRLRTVLGGRCEYAVSGAAPLGERLGHFYRGIGLTVLEGYGLTETTAALTANLPTMAKLGTVGRPLPGTSIRVADDGELQARGGQVFLGYWADGEATRATFTADGWFRTGDIGEIDDEGFVRVTGRRKEILITTGGKKVAPSVLEDRVRAHPLVSQCLVVGDGQPFIAALVTLDAEACVSWAARRSAAQRHAGNDLSTFARAPALLAEVEAAIDAANASVSPAESIRRFSVLPVSWTEEGGQLTPSHKLRRNVVLREFRAEVNTLYAR